MMDDRQGLECVDPWRVRRCDLMPMEATRPLPRVPPPKPEDWTEAGLHASRLRVQAAELDPPVVPVVATGTWAYESVTECLYHLREYRLDDPRLVLPEGRRAGPIVDKYAAWIRQGSEPPPGSAVELPSGRIQVDDGHHRASALRLAGRPVARLWVSPCAYEPMLLDPSRLTPRGLTHRTAVRQAWAEGCEVPPEVLADYPDILNEVRDDLERAGLFVPALRDEEADVSWVDYREPDRGSSVPSEFGR